jgi:hypothetical protein
LPAGSRAVSRPPASVVGSGVPATAIWPPATPDSSSATLTTSVRPEGGCRSADGGVPSTLTVLVAVAGLPAASRTVIVTLCAPSASPPMRRRPPPTLAHGTVRV